MNHYRVMFTLGLRLLGVYLIAMACLSFPGFVSEVVEQTRDNWPSNRFASIPPVLISLLLPYSIAILSLAAGLYFVLGGGWVIRLCLRSAGVAPDHAEHNGHDEGKGI